MADQNFKIKNGLTVGNATNVIDASGNWVGNTIPVAEGGTGLTSLTANGIVYASSSSALTTAAGTSGQVLLANSSAVPTWTSMSGDITITNAGVTAIGASKVTNTMLAGSIAASKLVGTDITTVGTIATGTWAATNISMGRGGTGASLTGVNGGIVYGNSTASMGITAAGTAGQLLESGGSGAPVWITATDANTASTVVKRDASGNFKASDPAAATDVATKQYVDNLAQGLDIKPSVKAATTANITLSNTQTIDGIALVANDRVLVKNQTTTSQNGIYVVAAGSWTAATDAASSSIGEGAFVWVEQGTANGDTGWVLTDSSTKTWTQFTGVGQIVAGNGLTKTEPNTLAVVGTANRITVNADSVDIASTYAGQSTITTLGTIATGTWNGSLIAGQYGGTGVNNSGKTITLGGNLTTFGAFATTLTVTGTTNVTLPTSGTLAVIDNGLDQFAATTSAELAGVISDETGSGALVFATSPSLTTPALSGETFSTAAAVTAGTNAQGQGALTSDYNVVTTAANNPSGVTLPTATAGRRIVIVNKGANAINVFPASGGIIDALATNASIQIPVNSGMEFNASSTTQWYSSFNYSTSGSMVSGNISGNAANVTGTVAVGNGGTGTTTAPTAGGIIYGASASAYGSTATGISGQVLVSGGVNAPTWSATPTLSTLTLSTSDSSANTVLYPLTVDRQTTGSAAAGMGTGISFKSETSGGSPITAGTLDVVLENPTNGTINSSFVIKSKVINTDTEIMRIGYTGNVGIGTATPGYKLDVSGTARVTGNSLFSSSTASSNTTSGALVVTGGVGISGAINVGGSLTVDTNTFYVDSTNNRVGVGTTSPTKKLDVIGTVEAHRLELVALGAPSTVSATTGTSGSVYYYFVQAYDADGNTGPLSSSVGRTSNTGITLTWSAVSGAAGYYVWRTGLSSLVVVGTSYNRFDAGNNLTYTDNAGSTAATYTIPSSGELSLSGISGGLGSGWSSGTVPAAKGSAVSSGFGARMQIANSGAISSTALTPITLQTDMVQGFITKIEYTSVFGSVEVKLWRLSSLNTADDLLYWSGNPTKHVTGDVDAIPVEVWGLAGGVVYLEVVNGSGSNYINAGGLKITSVRLI